MAKFPVNQKKPNMKSSNVVAPNPKKTARVQASPLGFATSNGDLGVIRNKSALIPKQTKYSSATISDMSHAMGNVMKKAGILV
jgi:hypothetical protein